MMLQTMTKKNSAQASATTNWNQLYRPRRVQDLHLTSVREALLQLMVAPHFPQALLFAGPKGTGKTSVARIIGALLNDPANDAAVEQRFFSHPDKGILPLTEPDPHSPLAESIFSGQSYVVQELDAASNRGIDDVRALKERCALSPSQGRVAVFILDEAHMLTVEAFNALLKLLEEPPTHVVFVLATTELHKLPATVVSRCHLVRFHKATPTELTVPLEAIIAAQQLTVDPAAVALIVRLADGSFRDAVKLLQQFVHQGGSPEQLAQLTETLSDAQLVRLVQAVVDKQPALVVQKLEALRQQGADEQHFLHSLINFLHRDVLLNLKVLEGSPHFTEKIARFFLQALTHPDLVKPTPIPFLRLELTLLDIIDRARTKAGESGKSRAPKVVESPSKDSMVNSKTAREKEVVLLEPTELNQMLATAATPLAESALKDTIGTISSDKPLGDGQVLCDRWSELIAKASSYNYGLAALLRSAQPIGGGEGAVVVRVYYTFHKEQLLQQKWRQFWDDLTTEVAGGVVALDCVVETVAQGELTEKAAVSPAVSLEALAIDVLMH